MLFYEENSYKEKYIECSSYDLTPQEKKIIEEFATALRLSHFKDYPREIKYPEKPDPLLDNLWRLRS